MLEELLRTLHNWFERDSLAGDLTVSGGALLVPDGFLQDGQWLRIEGSVFNDGLHRWPVSDLADETFDGKVTALAIPPAVVELADEIDRWRDKNGTALDSPYSSESFGGYSYSREASGSSGNASQGWRAHFRDRLNDWRKL